MWHENSQYDNNFVETQALKVWKNVRVQGKARPSKSSKPRAQGPWRADHPKTCPGKTFSAFTNSENDAFDLWKSELKIKYVYEKQTQRNA